MWTKRDIIAQAFNSLGLASYIYDIPSEQLETARRSLDSMMGAWNGRGIRVSYTMSSTANGGDIDDDSGLPDSAIDAVTYNLAMRIAASVGKVVTPDLRASANQSYIAMLSAIAEPMEMLWPNGVPAGAGHNMPNFPYLLPDDEGITLGNDSGLEFNA